MAGRTVLQNPVKILQGMELYYTGDIAVIVMGDGENRLNLNFLRNLITLLDEIERNDQCKGLITTAKGKFYGNGLDLQWLSTASYQERFDFFKTMNDIFIRLVLFPIPTLAAISGHAFAGGALFAIAHDIRIQREDKGWLCFNEVFINRQFIKYQYHIMRAKIGSGLNYTDAVLLGKRYTGKEALESGLVHATASESRLLSDSVHLLKSFYGKSGYPRDSLNLMKQDVYSDAVRQYEIDQKDIENVVTRFAKKSKL